MSAWEFFFQWHRAIFFAIFVGICLYLNHKAFQGGMKIGIERGFKAGYVARHEKHLGRFAHELMLNLSKDMMDKSNRTLQELRECGCPGCVREEERRNVRS